MKSLIWYMSQSWATREEAREALAEARKYFAEADNLKVERWGDFYLLEGSLS